MVKSLDPKRGSCVFSCGAGGFRVAQCPQVSIVERVLPFAGCRTWRYNDEKKTVTAKMLWREWNTSEDSQRTLKQKCQETTRVCISFSLTTDVQILISGIKLLSSWEHPVRNSWRSCSRRYGTMLKTDPSTLASLSPNFFQTLSSQLTRNTTNSKVRLTKRHGSRVNSYNAMKGFSIFLLSSCTPF